MPPTRWSSLSSHPLGHRSIRSSRAQFSRCTTIRWGDLQGSRHDGRALVEAAPVYRSENAMVGHFLNNSRRRPKSHAVLVGTGTNHECHADFISHIKDSCREDGGVKYSLFVNAIRTVTTSIPALSARQRVTPWGKDEDIQTSRQDLMDTCRALQVDRNSAIARRKVELAS